MSPYFRINLFICECIGIRSLPTAAWTRLQSVLSLLIVVSVVAAAVLLSICILFARWPCHPKRSVTEATIMKSAASTFLFLYFSVLSCLLVPLCCLFLFLLFSLLSAFTAALTWARLDLVLAALWAKLEKDLMWCAFAFALCLHQKAAAKVECSSAASRWVWKCISMKEVFWPVLQN